MKHNKCLDCNKIIDPNESKHARYDLRNTSKLVGYTCTNCYLKSISNDTFDTFDKI